MKKRFGAVLLISSLLVTSCGNNEVEEAPPAQYKAASYDVVVKEGYGGDIKVSVTFSDYRLESIYIGENNETPGIGSKAIEELPEKIVEAQSLAIDNISGATVTSDAIKSAVKIALIGADADLEDWK